ncbi:MAG: hypothetical protein ACE5G0_16280 [Rhodothermales bacterium]
MPLYAQGWVLLLMTVNMMVPLFFLDRLEAQVILGTFIASALLMFAITARSGFSRLLGAGHFLWFPLLYFLWTRLDQIPADDVFGLWIRVLMVMNAISLVIDVMDVLQYITGDRTEMVEES